MSNIVLCVYKPSTTFFYEEKLLKSFFLKSFFGIKEVFFSFFMSFPNSFSGVGLEFINIQKQLIKKKLPVYFKLETDCEENPTYFNLRLEFVTFERSVAFELDIYEDAIVLTPKKESLFYFPRTLIELSPHVANSFDYEFKKGDGLDEITLQLTRGFVALFSEIKPYYIK